MTRTLPLAWAICWILTSTTGCTTAALFYQPPPPPEMLGSKTDQIMLMQEENAEAAKFVVYQHEFVDVQPHPDTPHSDLQLNEYGEDHLRQIAASLRAGAPWPVVVERSQTSPKQSTQFKYPVHFNPDLDLRRREAVVRALVRMGIADADTRVVVAPAFSQGLSGMEASGAYAAGMSGGGGGFGGGGMGGGFGGGFF